MIVLINKKKINTDICKNFKLLIGFMFNFSQKKAKLLLFNKKIKVSLHMFFVFFPLVVVLIDENKKILHLKKLYPFTLYNSNIYAKYVLEIPIKLAKNLNVRKGDKIKFISK